jgi:hypothetical protein
MIEQSPEIIRELVYTVIGAGVTLLGIIVYAVIKTRGKK